MSLVSDAMATALDALATAVGQTVEQRLGTSGQWATLANAFLEQGDAQIIDYDEKHRAVMAPARATLRVAVGQTRLVAALVSKPGSYVRHTLGTNVTEWAVVGAMHHDGMSMYELQRTMAQSAGDPRDGTPS